MKLLTTLISCSLLSLGLAAPTCDSTTGSYYLQIGGQNKNIVENIYQEKYSDAKIPEGPLKVTMTSDGDLRVNFEEVEPQVFDIDCSGSIKAKESDTVSSKTIFNGGNQGGNHILDGLNNWTVNWNGPNLNLEMPGNGLLGFPMFRLQAVPAE